MNRNTLNRNTLILGSYARTKESRANEIRIRAKFRVSSKCCKVVPPVTSNLNFEKQEMKMKAHSNV